MWQTTLSYFKKLPGEGNGNPLQYSCLEKSMDRGVWQAEVHGVHDWACVHEGGGRWVGSNKLVEKKKKEIATATLTFSNYHSGQQPSIPKQDPPPAKELQLAEGSNDN